LNLQPLARVIGVDARRLLGPGGTVRSDVAFRRFLGGLVISTVNSSDRRMPLSVLLAGIYDKIPPFPGVMGMGRLIRPDDAITELLRRRGHAV
jgi:hypothetical protein